MDSAIYTSASTPYVTFKFTYELTKAGSTDGYLSMKDDKKLYDKVLYELMFGTLVVKGNSNISMYVEP